MRRAALIVALCAAAACGGPHPYNFSRAYEPLKAERDLYRDAVTPPFEDVLRDPVRYEHETLSWFGMVQAVAELPSGGLRLTLSHRTHQARHLCSERAESSCRLTVSAREGGTFSVDLQLRPEDRQGKDRIWEGSLIRVYGTAATDADADGNPVLRVLYYRHWPRGMYVTTAARATMRR